VNSGIYVFDGMVRLFLPASRISGTWVLSRQTVSRPSLGGMILYKCYIE
jgi:hypothetical protein